MSTVVAAPQYAHITTDGDGIPTIRDANMKVVELVTAKLAYGWSPEELKFQHPHLSLGQIYSALAYYADHQDAFHQDIERRFKDIETLKKSLPEPDVAARLRVYRQRARVSNYI
ncbi:MAG: DUF433 domain-containing protein [Pseudomonadota bacterium]